MVNENPIQKIERQAFEAIQANGSPENAIKCLEERICEVEKSVNELPYYDSRFITISDDSIMEYASVISKIKQLQNA